ncbi:MAG TPA: UDP-N-acetylmuramate dehydrogenase [Bacteroidota bacterium]|nr:UDP-N-acetylmuramate dehydrogenase [Candidatus Kapabacteria bacterium]HRS01796.1 UDP-N-acetylmuramate dehydrogenase [Bacteroidota bacterium]
MPNYNLRKYNTFDLNIVAKYFVILNNINDIENILFFIREHSINNILFLGAGSNILFSKDYCGLVIKNEIKGIQIIEDTDDYSIVEVGAGENWDEFVRYTINHNLYGLENLALIPSTVGAAPIQNIGAYGAEQSDCFFEAYGYNFLNNKFESYSLSNCNFDYRSSIFKNELKYQFLITNVRYKLHKSFSPNIEYKDLHNYIEKNNIELTAQNIYNSIAEIRKNKLPDPKLIPNAGSFFKNPIIDKEHFENLINKYPDLKYYPVNGNYYKIPAAYLIEKAGWKGKSLGRAGVYSNHSLILINLGDADSKEILNLANNIINSVKNLFNIQLELEVNII